MCIRDRSRTPSAGGLRQTEKEPKTPKPAKVDPVHTIGSPWPLTNRITNWAPRTNGAGGYGRRSNLRADAAKQQEAGDARAHGGAVNIAGSVIAGVDQVASHQGLGRCAA